MPRRVLACMLFVATSVLGGGVVRAQQDSLAAREKWVAVDLFHASRTLPSLARMLELPLNPGVQVRYHDDWLQGRSTSLGGSVQAGILQFDRLFWEPSLGVGLDGVLRPGYGIFAAFGLRLDYARAFTGSNNFERDGTRYEQTTDTGRGYLRATLVEVTLGYSPSPLATMGIVPALRYAWLVELPLYPNDGASPWSYTQAGVSILWLFGRNER